MTELGTVAMLRRYPVKSMLGEQISHTRVSRAGVEHDRAFALIDQQTGRVASAKQPKLWRKLLQCSAGWDDAAVVITLPDGRTMSTADPHGNAVLSEMLDRQVTLSQTRPHGASMARLDAEDAIANDLDADVDYQVLELGQGTTGTSFVDYAPVSLITTSTLDRMGSEMIRYRPNVVLQTGSSVPPFTENDWAGREIQIGEVRLRGIIPTPRCAIPTLEHGSLPRRTEAVRTLLEDNRIDVPGFGMMPCAGLYAEVVDAGTLCSGDPVTLG